MADKLPWERDWSAPTATRRPANPAQPPAQKAPWEHDWQGHAAAGSSAHPADLFASGEVHDGDTFRLTNGQNARLYGVDAFELNQTGRTRSGEEVPLGREARDALAPYARPGATVSPTGAVTYGRPVASLDNGGDAAEALIRQGNGIATPEYLANDPVRLPQYMEAERDARQNRRGAWQTSFEQPASYRHGTVDPWNPVASGEKGDDRAAVFWDDPLPNRGLRPEVGQGYLAVWQDPASTPDDLLAYAKANGFTIDAAATRKAYAERDKGRPAGGELSYTTPPRVLTDKGDGTVGAAGRGLADPFNVLDETGALVDSLVPGSGRESVWNSDRRFGDVYANNLDQNRAILEYDEAAHPYARFGGQLASGLVVPGASVEGVGFGAARSVLRTGGTRYAAEQAARAAVVRRLGIAGAVEGGAAGAGQGEDWQGRATGSLIGTVAGAGLGTLTGYALPKVAQFVGRKGRGAAGRESDAAVDAGGIEPPVPAGKVRVYHSGAAGEGQTGRWVSTNRQYAADYRQDLPLFYRDLDANDPRVNDLDYPDQTAGTTFNFELSPDEAVGLQRIERGGADTPASDTTGSPSAASVEQDPLVTPPPAFERPMPENTYRAPLSDHAPVVWREMSFNGDGFGRLTMPSEFAGRWRNEGGTDLLQFADTPALATGQGTNKGFLFEYDSAPFVGRPQFDKPGAALAWRNGAGEYATSGVTQEMLQGALRGFKIKPGAVDDLAPADRDVLGLITRDLEGRGWSRLDAEDGSVIYRRPDRVQPMENETATATPEGPRVADRIDVTGRATPLLDAASDDLRRQQAGGLSPRDVLPRPANEVGSLEEAERIAAGRIAPVRTPNEADMLERRTVPNATTGAPIPKRGPLDMVSWLRSQGGVRPAGGELQRSGIDNAPRKGMDFAGGETRFGRLVNDDGMSYDEAAQRAWEAGFFPDHAERPTVSEFLDALSATHSGRNRAFRTDDLAEVDAFETARRQRHEVEAARQDGAPLVEDRGYPVGPDDLEANRPPVEAYEEWGETPPDFAGNIRLSNLDSPQSIARVLVHTEQRVGGFDAATRGRITQAETERLAGELGMTADDLLKRRKGQAFNAEEALAARQILARSATDLVNMARRMQRVDDPGEELEAAFKQAWLRHVAIQEQVSGATAEAGRALAAFRIAADARAVDRVLPSLGDIAGGTTRLKDAADLIVENAGNPAGLNDATARALKPRFRDKLIELYYNSLLSGPTTHAVNILGNTITALGQLPEHGVAAAIGTGRRLVKGGDVDRVLFGEVGARAIGLLQGTREGLRQAARTFANGEPADAVTKVEAQVMRAIPGPVGSVIRTPTRALAAEDELFKAMARRMELTGLAVRQARREGLAGAEAKARAGELLANPTDEMLARSFEYGRYLTFQSPLGQAGRHVSAFVEALPALKLIIPFIRTPTNILKFAIERSPGAPLLKEWRKDIAAGGAKRDLALAKVMLGSGIAATIFQMASEGKVTGNGPADDSAKRLLMASGWQPYSFKVGDRYYSYGRLDPYSSIIGTAADIVDLQRQMTDKQREHSSMLVGTAILHNLANKTWLSGLSTALEAVNDPDRNLENFESRTLGAIAVPAIVAQTNRIVDPIMREARDPISRIRSRIPGKSTDLPARRDVFGRPVINAGGVGPDILSPIATSQSRPDATVDALLDARIRLGMPARRDYTPEQYSAYVERAGAIMKPELDALASSKEWRTMDRDERQDAVDDVVKDARAHARDEMPDALAPWQRAAAAPWESYGARR